jgi:hypothetical protein
MYQLIDTFNERLISRHRTLDALARAERRFDRAVKRNNGPGSYIPTGVLAPDGTRIDLTDDRDPSGRHPEWDDLMVARDRAAGIDR